MQSGEVEIRIIDKYIRYIACYILYLCILMFPGGVALKHIKIENCNIEQLCVSTILIYVCTVALKYLSFSKSNEIKKLPIEISISISTIYLITFGLCVFLSESYAVM